MRTTVSFFYARKIIETYHAHGITIQQAAQKVFGDRGVPMYVQDVSAEVAHQLDAADPMRVEMMVEKAAEQPWPESVKIW